MGKSKINFKSKDVELIVSSENMTFMNKALELITSQLGDGKVIKKFIEPTVKIDNKGEVKPTPTEYKPSEDTRRNLPPIRVLMCSGCGDFIVFNKNTLDNPDEFTCKKCGSKTKVVPDTDDSLDIVEYDCPCCGAYHGVTTDTTYTELYVKCRQCKVPLDVIWNSDTGEFDVLVSDEEDEY